MFFLDCVFLHYRSNLDVELNCIVSIKNYNKLDEIKLIYKINFNGKMFSMNVAFACFWELPLGVNGTFSHRESMSFKLSARKALIKVI
jgi:hypothetical protein